MKPDLLNNVLREGSYETFRENLLRQVEVEARRKRLARAGRWLALAASVLIAFILYRAPHQENPIPIASVQVAPIAPANPTLLHTSPLKPSQVLQSRPLLQNLILATDQNRRATPITDSELLALFPKKPVGLASTTQGTRRLLFLNPADERRFMTSN